MVRRVRPDAAVARSRVRLSELNVERARREHAGGDFDAALIFAEQSLINGADAVLARDGFGANSHVVRFSYPTLPAIYAQERQLIDQIRASRNRAQYDAGGVGIADHFWVYYWAHGRVPGLPLERRETISAHGHRIGRQEGDLT